MLNDRMGEKVLVEEHENKLINMSMPNKFKKSVRF